MEHERRIKRAKDREKTRGDWERGRKSSPFPQSPLVFLALSLALFFARAPLSERLEQAKGGPPSPFFLDQTKAHRV